MALIAVTLDDQQWWYLLRCLKPDNDISKNFQCHGRIGLRQIEQVLSSISTIFEDFWQKNEQEEKPKNQIFIG